MSVPQYIKDRIIALLLEGCSASQIADKVPNQGLTRNSVLGIIHRINKKRIKEGLAPYYKANATPIKIKIKLGYAKMIKTKIKVKRSKKLPVPKLVYSARVDSIVTVTGCRFFVKDVCCNKSLYNNSMWCEKHYSIVYDRTKTTNLNSNRALRRFR